MSPSPTYPFINILLKKRIYVPDYLDNWPQVQELNSMWNALVLCPLI